MKLFKNKKIVIALAISAAMSMTVFTGEISLASPPETNVSVNVSVSQSTPVVNWEKGSEADVVAEGIGKSGGNGTTMARMAAKLDAQRNLLGMIKGVQIDSETIMQDLIVSNDTVSGRINGILQGAEIVEERELDNGEYYVKMRVPVYGASNSLAAAVVPALVNQTPEAFPVVNETKLSPEAIHSIGNAAYTGVIIDASGLGLQPTFSPVIYDTEGRAIYGIKNLNYDAVISEGMVSYTHDLESAYSSRAGSNPLVVKAVSASGGRNSTNAVNAVVTVKDADTILYANESTGILNNCAVVFVR